MSLSYLKKEKRGRMSIAGRFIVVLLSILFLTSSAEAEFLAQKSDTKKSLFGSDRKEKKNDDESMTDLAFLWLVTGFADNYAARLTQSNVTLQKGLKINTNRLAAFNIFINAINTAYEISISPNSFIAIMDMTVMVTLQRMAWEEYWYPKRFGRPAKDYLKALQLLEKKIWEIAGKFLTGEQERDLRNLIQKWRKTNPDQQIVYSVRFAEFRDELGTGLKDPKGLFSGVKKAANAAEELRILGDRYRFLLTRMQMMLNPQLQLAYLQIVSRPEVSRLLKDAGRVTASFESIAATASSLPETAKTIIKETGAQTEQFRKLVDDMQQMLTIGNEVVISVNKTLDSIDTLVSRFDPIREKNQGTEPIDIAEYRGAAKDFTETAREANLLIQSLDRLLTGQMEASRRPGLLEAVGKIGQESRDLIDYIFYRVTILCILIIVGIILSLLIYRYVSVKLSDPRRKQKSFKTTDKPNTHLI